jgi:hypothetical protein
LPYLEVSFLTTKNGIKVKKNLFSKESDKFFLLIRDLEPGDVILKERAAVVGPRLDRLDRNFPRDADPVNFCPDPEPIL